MKQPDGVDEFVRADVLPKNLPQSFTRDINEGLTKIYEANVQRYVLLSALLLNLAECEDHVLLPRLDLNPLLFWEQFLRQDL